ncbi:transposase family protein [Pelomicrobium sp.]|jgi:transposase|uniref:transposase family protein n=1 Tax=Pelomicrobium sp. TaxID=2815319 RepID=UPI002FDD3B3A
MRDIELYAQILGLRSPWKVAEVQLLREAEEVRVHVVPEPGATWTCPYCGRPSPGYDSRRRRWRHLDTCQYKTVLEADVPRVRCAEHGVVTVSVPRAEPGSGFTALFEALIIDWLKEASTQAVGAAIEAELACHRQGDATRSEPGHGPAQGEFASVSECGRDGFCPAP